MVSARAVRVRMAYLEPFSGGVGRCLTEKRSEPTLTQQILSQKACLFRADRERNGGLRFRKDPIDLDERGTKEGGAGNRGEPVRI